MSQSTATAAVARAATHARRGAICGGGGPRGRVVSRALERSFKRARVRENLGSSSDDDDDDDYDFGNYDGYRTDEDLDSDDQKKPLKVTIDNDHEEAKYRTELDMSRAFEAYKRSEMGSGEGKPETEQQAMDVQLHEALYNYDILYVYWLLEKGADAAEEIQVDWTKKKGKVYKAFKKLFDRKGSEEASALELAVALGFDDAVKAILRNGYTIDADEGEFWSQALAEALDQLYFPKSRARYPLPLDTIELLYIMVMSANFEEDPEVDERPKYLFGRAPGDGGRKRLLGCVTTEIKSAIRQFGVFDNHIHKPILAMYEHISYYADALKKDEKRKASVKDYYAWKGEWLQKKYTPPNDDDDDPEIPEDDDDDDDMAPSSSGGAGPSSAP